MLWVQVLLIAAGVGLFLLILTSASAHTLSASKKIGLVLLFMLMIISVIFPNVTQHAANLLGVGRGADLVFYAATTAFLIYSVTQYMRAQLERDRLHRLARRLALSEAWRRYPPQ